MEGLCQAGCQERACGCCHRQGIYPSFKMNALRRKKQTYFLYCNCLSSSFLWLLFRWTPPSTRMLRAASRSRDTRRSLCLRKTSPSPTVSARTRTKQLKPYALLLSVNQIFFFLLHRFRYSSAWEVPKFLSFAKGGYLRQNAEEVDLFSTWIGVRLIVMSFLDDFHLRFLSLFFFVLA